MAQVTLPIGGANYVVGCQDGEEEHLHYLVKEVEKRFSHVRTHLAPAGESHALFLTTLLLADEIHDLKHGKVSDEAQKVLTRAEETIAAHERHQSRLSHAAELAERLVKRVGALSEAKKDTDSEQNPSS